jgi:hypothetical protein
VNVELAPGFAVGFGDLVFLCLFRIDLWLHLFLFAFGGGSGAIGGGSGSGGGLFGLGRWFGTGPPFRLFPCWATMETGRIS